jgi:membrane-associated phospholipid phosphatase
MKASSEEQASARREGASVGAAKLIGALGRNMARNLVQWSRPLRRPPQKQVPPPAKYAIAIVVIALAATVVSMFLIDSAADSWAHRLPQWFKNAFEHITNAGLSGWYLVPSGVIVLALAALTSPGLPPAAQSVLAVLADRFGFLFWAIAAPGLFTTIIKRLIGRARPYMDVHGDPFTYAPFAWRPEYASLPSGHGATVGALALAIGALWPRSRPFMWLFALLIMFSRVVVQAHHPSDVIAGALVGAVGAAWLRRYFAARGLVFSASDLAAEPGPSFKQIQDAVRQAFVGLRERKAV